MRLEGASPLRYDAAHVAVAEDKMVFISISSDARVRKTGDQLDQLRSRIIQVVGHGADALQTKGSRSVACH